MAKAKQKGRPTTYSPDILKKTLQYIEKSKDEIEEYHKTRGVQSNSYERLVKPGLPTRDGLALFLNVHRDTIHQWSTIHQEFSDTLDIIDAMQKQMLILGGLSGDYNPVIAKLILSSNHGMKEKNETELSNPDGNLKTIVINKYGSNDKPAA
jgi:hypothetical protein